SARRPPIEVNRLPTRGARGGSSVFDQRVRGRERARRVGGGGRAREVEGLAAAAAEVDGAPRAALARLGHPGLTSEQVHAWSVVPYGGERFVARVLELNP